MNSWEYLWVTIQRDIKFLEIGDWHIVLPDKTKIQGKPLVEEYINSLGAQGWEQISSVGEHWAEATWMNAIHLFFKRPK